MAWNRLAKVLDFERALEAGSEEAAERGDEGGEGCEDENVELNGSDVQGQGSGHEGRDVDVVGLGFEDGVWIAGEAGEDVGAEVLIKRVSGIYISSRGSRIGRGTLTGQMKYL